MDERYAQLGIQTAWSRRRAEEGIADAAAEFRRRLSQIESGAGLLNLNSAAVHVAAEIAALEPSLADQQRLALILLVTASLIALAEGSTRLPVCGADAREPMRRMLEPLCGDAFGPDGAEAMAVEIERMLAAGAAPHVIGGPDEYRPLIYVAPFIYHHRVRAAEIRLAALFAQRLAAAQPALSRPDKIEAAIADTLSRPGRFAGRPLMLSEEQLSAIACAAGLRLSVISGGPGTGKTSIIVAIVRVLVRLGIDPQKIALAAPTGKAAFRIGENLRDGLEGIDDSTEADRALKASCPQPSTIHRLLRYSPSQGRFAYHRNNPLSAEAVIVDESSMLDLSLMERLVGAVKAGSRLILLGDADQLPSVAAGAVFRDLVAASRAGVPSAGSGQAPARHLDPAICTRLTHNYRMDAGDSSGRSLLGLARAINSGIPDALDQCDGGGAPAVRRDRPEELSFEGVEFIDAGGRIESLLDRWFKIKISTDEIVRLAKETFTQSKQGFDVAARAGLERIFDHLAACRILCLTRVLPTGSERINSSLHRRAAQSAGVAPDRPEFLPGEPVMVVRNDYERMLFNGDQGVILRVRRGGSRAALMAVFKRADGFEAFHLAALRELLELCYATTIHKAQGSEFDSVAIVLPESDLPILNREILYTGVTRGRRAVVLAGNEELLRAGIARTMERYSGLGDQLAVQLTRAP